MQRPKEGNKIEGRSLRLFQIKYAIGNQQLAIDKLEWEIKLVVERFFRIDDSFGESPLDGVFSASW
jgi:hypothetical protein